MICFTSFKTNSSNFFYTCFQTYANESHNLQSYIYIDKKDNILIFSFNLFLKQPIGFLDFTWS